MTSFEELLICIHLNCITTLKMGNEQRAEDTGFFPHPKNVLEVFCIYSGSLNITLKHLNVIVDICTGTVAYFLCMYTCSWKDYLQNSGTNLSPVLS